MVVRYGRNDNIMTAKVSKVVQKVPIDEKWWPTDDYTISHPIDICTATIKNIRCMHTVSTNQVSDIFHFNDNIR